MMPALIFGLVAVGYLFLLKGRWALNPGPLFIFFNIIMFYGVYYIHDPENLADREHLWLMVLGVFGFTIGGLFRDYFGSREHAKVHLWWKKPADYELGAQFRMLAGGLVILSCVIATWYYSKIGYNLFLQSLKGGLVEDAASMRIAAYSGDQYFAPGYVNQFKNVILPLLTLTFSLYWISKRQPIPLLILKIGALAIVSVIFLLGTGQRGPFVLATLMSLAACYAFLSSKNFRRIGTLVAVVGTSLFLVNTIFLQRSELTTSSITDQVVRRIVNDNQESALVGFRVVREKPIAMGREWFVDIRGFLPAYPPSTLANEIFEVLYGSTRGTAPVSLWVSIWHNTGWYGMPVVGILLGLIYHSFFWRMLQGPKHLVRVVCYGGYTVLLGTWIVGGAGQLANTGFAAVLLIHIAFKWSQRGGSRRANAREVDRSPQPTGISRLQSAN